MWNLLSNAIRFTRPAGANDVWLEAYGGQEQIRVVDTGSGIKREFLPHVFERFRQADASSSRTHSGLGIGLALVRHLVELHGGAVVAESEGEGRGATFSVRLPRRAPDADVGPIALEAVPDFADPSRHLAGLHVLVVDDEADARELARLAFEQAGARVSLAASAREALATVDAGRVDVLVSDIGMPGTNGYVLLESMRGRGADGAPAIALTAYARLEDRERVEGGSSRTYPNLSTRCAWCARWRWSRVGARRRAGPPTAQSVGRDSCRRLDVVGADEIGRRPAFQAVLARHCAAKS